VRFNPTKQMIEARRESIQVARDTARQLIAAARVAHDAIVPLPHINEDGESVQHGANVQMTNVRNALIDAFNSLSWVISPDYDFREYIDLLKFTHKFAGNRFRSDKEWTNDFSHLDAEIVRLKEKLGE